MKRVRKSPTKSKRNAEQSGREAVKSPTKPKKNVRRSGREVVKSPTKSKRNAEQSGREVVKSPTKSRENAEQSGREVVKSPTKSKRNAERSGREVVKSPTKSRENAEQSGREVVKSPTKLKKNAEPSGMKEEKAMRTRKEVLEYGLSFPNTYQDAPFRDINWQLVRCKKNKKAFLWIYERDGNLCINIKVNAEWRDLWRATYPAVLPGYHQNKEYWNTVILDGTVPIEEIKRMIAESYDLVVPNRKK